MLNIITGTEMDRSEEELSDELYVGWLSTAITDNKGVNGDEGSKGNDGGNGNNGGNSGELSSIHFPNLVFASFKAVELIIVSAI